MEHKEHLIDISWYTILKLAVLFFTVYLIYALKDILILTLFSLVISILFEPPIRFLEKAKVPRGLAVVFLYLSSFVLFSLLLYLPLASLAQELKNLIVFFPYYFERFSPPLRALGLEAFEDVQTFIQNIEGTARTLSKSFLALASSLFGGLSSTLFVLTISIFLSLEGKAIERNITLLFPKKEEKYILSLWRKTEHTVAMWFVKLALSSVFVGVLSYVGFWALRIKYPLSLAVLGGLLNLIPLIGPTIALFFILLLGLFDSVAKALLASLIFVVVQQIENNIFTPLITKKLIDISPTMVLIGLAVGFKLFGLIGGILTIPLIAMILEFARGLLEKKRETESAGT